jgi:serine/threonine protein kinase
MSKKFLKSKFPTGNNLSAYEFVKEELKVLQRLEHPNIIYLHEIIDDPKRDHIYLITQYHSKGSLGEKLEEKNNLY